MRLLLRWWTGFFAAATVGFAIFPAHIFRGLNAFGRVVVGWTGPSIPVSGESFWRILAVSLTAVLTVLSMSAARDVRRNLDRVPYIILAKGVTTLGFLVAYLGIHYFAYFVGLVVDGMIFLLTWYCYSGARRM